MGAASLEEKEEARLCCLSGKGFKSFCLVTTCFELHSAAPLTPQPLPAFVRQAG